MSETIELYQCNKCKKVFDRTLYGKCPDNKKCNGNMRKIVEFEILNI